MPTKYVEVQGHAIYYYYVGPTTLPDVIPDFSRGRKIVFIHAAGSNGNAWHRQLDQLGAAHSPIALDLPGHGRSSGVEGLKSIGEYSDFMVRFMDALGLKSAVIAGRSMGGAIAMEMAARHGARVQALVLMATAARFNIAAKNIAALGAVMRGRAPQAFQTTGFSPKTVSANFNVVREAWMEQVKTDPRVRYTDAVACSEADLRQALGKIEQPGLILAGADDQVTTVADAEFISSKLGRARLEVIAEAAHNLPTEKPREVNAAIEQFLASLDEYSVG